MIRKFTLLFLLCIGIQGIVKAQTADSVTISIAPYTDTSCYGSQLRFTAVQSNDTFSTTSYHWYTNGMFTGVIIDTFYTTALNTGDTVNCVIYFIDSVGNLDSARSNTITVYHSDSIAAGVIAALTTGLNPDCGGHALTFTAFPINGGTAPVYQWMVNDSAVAGADSTTFSGIFPAGDTISCMMVSNSPCAITDTVYSAGIPILHYNLTASATVTVARNPICAGSHDTLTATLTNEGSGSSVAWYIDSSSVVSAIGNVYATDSLHDGDLVYCILTSPDSCILNHTAISNVITMDVIADLPDNVSIAITHGSNPGCLDSPITFTATYADFGTSPSTTWYINGIPTDQNTLSLDTTLLTGDTVTFQIRATDGGCYANDTLTTPAVGIVRDSTPVTPLVSLDGDLLIANTIGTYTWYDSTVYDSSSQLIPGAIDKTYHPTVLGYYWAVLDSANCPSLPSNVIYISLLGVKTINNAANIKAYPNPTSGILNLDFGTSPVNTSLDVYNMKGEIMKHEDISNQTHYEVDLSAMAAGDYLVDLKDQTGTTSTFKVMLGK